MPWGNEKRRKSNAKSSVSKARHGEKIELVTLPIEEEIEFADDKDLAPVKQVSVRTGLPHISKFYKDFKTSDKRIQMKQHEENPTIAYIEEAARLKIVPEPTGIVSHKGLDNIIDLN